MTEPVFLRVVALSGVPRNKVRAHLCGRPVNAGARRKIRVALETLADQDRAAHRARSAA